MASSFMLMDELVVTARFDPEAKVWVAESEQIGIATEAPTLDALVNKLPGMIWDLNPELELPELTLRIGRPYPVSTDRPERRSGLLY
jgi:Domain of unknown function (DUF1902)